MYNFWKNDLNTISSVGLAYLLQSMTTSNIMRNYKRNFTVCVQTYLTGKKTLKNYILQKKNLKSRSSSTNMKSPFKGFCFLHFL